MQTGPLVAAHWALARQQLRRQHGRSGSGASTATAFPSHCSRRRVCSRGADPTMISVPLAGNRRCGKASLDMLATRWMPFTHEIQHALVDVASNIRLALRHGSYWCRPLLGWGPGRRRGAV
jgi:hypothetical protein